MTNLPVGKELDAAVLAAIGWTQPTDEDVEHDYWTNPEWPNVRTHILLLSISASDAEAVRLCGPWLDEHCIQWSTGKMLFGMFAHGWLRDERGLCSATVYDRYYDSLAEALCRLVLAVAAREDEQKEPTR